MNMNNIQRSLDAFAETDLSRLSDEQIHIWENLHIVAHAALSELEENGTIDFLLIKNPNVRSWWEENK